MTEKKVPLILFSGGMDSTTLLFRHPHADTLSVDFGNSWSKTAHEKEAQLHIRDYIDRCNSDVDGYRQGKSFRDSYHVTADFHPNALNQMPVWFMKVFEHAKADRHSEVMIGICPGDDSVSSVWSLQAAWDNLWHATRIFSYDERPKMSFPVLHSSKAAQMRELPDDLIKLTWSCEDPYNKSGKECGKCKPCITKFTELIKAGKLHLAEETYMKNASNYLLNSYDVGRINNLRNNQAEYDPDQMTLEF